MGWSAAWAMAVGGMIGGGIYTLAGVVLGLAGPLAWMSLVGGGLVALATVRSYYDLTREVARDGVPLTLLLQRGHPRIASVLAWWLLLVYVLATAVYAFTFGQYVGAALAAPPWVVVGLIYGVVAALAGVNLLGIKEPAAVQIAAVVIELAILALIAAVGFWRWTPANLFEGVPAGSLSGVVTGLAATFIAFEGFEMLAYDLRETKAPRLVLTTALPAAVVAVAVAYAAVTVGAASLVGAAQLVAHKEHALAIAGQRAAGTAGLVVVSIAACASAASAINATLFSVSRLARSAAEARLVPAAFLCENARGCPYWALLALGLLSATVAATSSLEPLVQAASLAFLVLFAYVNGLAFSTSRNVLSLLGMLGAGVSAVVVLARLAAVHPAALGIFALGWFLSVIAHGVMEARRDGRVLDPPGAPLCDFTTEGCPVEEPTAG